MVYPSMIAPGLVAAEGLRCWSVGWVQARVDSGRGFERCLETSGPVAEMRGHVPRDVSLCGRVSTWPLVQR